jgi:hypothetical protein
MPRTAALDDDPSIERARSAKQVGAPKEGCVMHPLMAYEVAKLRMAERHEEASRERLAKQARAMGSDDEQETSVWRRWTLRRLVGRVTLATARA